MNKSTLKFCVVATLGAMCVAGYAQSAGPTNGQIASTTSGKTGIVKRPNAMQISNTILKKMDLNKDQWTKIAELEKQVATDTKALHKSKPSPEDRKTKIKAIREEYKNGLEAILSPEQQQQYKDLLKQYRKENKKKPKTGNPPPSS